MGEAVNDIVSLMPLGAAHMIGGTVRQQFAVAEESIRAMPNHLTADDLNKQVAHVFAPGAVARTMNIPAGQRIIGKIHKHAHLNILSQGTVTVFTEAGGLETLTGPLVMCSPPGTKRMVRADTDAVWTTIHLTSETDLARIEEEVIAPDFESYDRFIEQQKALQLAQGEQA